ncbi:MAG: adenylyltransferase/cytidyltransferase family protein, partial [Bacteroidales bacterium]|nr:adenylyltransferase/cytidyltransferase family protein [Bacteroidales bacterium]
MRIGIFGGSFNPIHTGHAMLANWITQFTDIDRVWLMVSPQNPLKDGYSKMLDMARLRMAEMVSAHCT